MTEELQLNQNFYRPPIDRLSTMMGLSWGWINADIAIKRPDAEANLAKSKTALLLLQDVAQGRLHRIGNEMLLKMVYWCGAVIVENQRKKAFAERDKWRREHKELERQWRKKSK